VTRAPARQSAPDTADETRPSRWRGIAAHVALAVVAALVALAVVAPHASSSGDVLFGRVTVSGSTEHGTTRVAVPPVGSMAAQTHAGPLGVVVQLDLIDIDEVADGDWNSGALADDATAGVTEVAVDWARSAAIASALVGAVLGLAAASVFPCRRWRRLLSLATVGAVSGAAAVAVAAGVALASFTPEAFSEPTFDGSLTYAPAVLEALNGTADGLDSVATAAGAVTSRIEVLAAAANGDVRADEQPGDVTLLHVSDLHLNPLGAQLVVQLADSFEPDAVIDTGDFTSYGWPDVEALYAELVDVDVPYYLTPGNHDAADLAGLLPDDGVVTVVDGDTVDIAGLTYGGLADPTFTPAGEQVDDDVRRERAAAYERQGPAIDAFVATNEPDVLALHNPAQARFVDDRELTVVSGHTHRFWFETDGRRSVAVSSSTGADGLGAMSQEDPPAFGAQLLRFRPNADGTYRLWSVDRIEVDTDTLLSSGPGRFRIERIDVARSDGRRYLTDDAIPADEGPVATLEGSPPTTLPTSVPPEPAPDATPTVPGPGG
jgi:predicted phosphodiesterase